MSTKIINEEVYIIPEGLNLNPHKHRDAKNWVALWFYKGRHKSMVLADQLESDKIITSKLEYQKNIFYKMSSMSNEDEYFDYFFKLKDGSPNNLVKKNNRYKKQILEKRKNITIIKLNPINVIKTGNLLLHFLKLVESMVSFIIKNVIIWVGRLWALYLRNSAVGVWFISSFFI